MRHMFATAIAIALVAGCDANTGVNTDTTYCIDNGDCAPGSSCMQLEGSTDQVCIDNDTSQHLLTCASDVDCDSGYCVAVTGLDETVCLAAAPMPEVTCPFADYDNLLYYVVVNGYTVVVQTEYVEASCQLLMYSQEDPTDPNWTYVFERGEGGAMQAYGVYSGEEVEIMYFTRAHIKLIESHPYNYGGGVLVLDFVLVPSSAN